MAPNPSTGGPRGGRRVHLLAVAGVALTVSALGAILGQVVAHPPASASSPYQPAVTAVAPVYRGGVLAVGGGIAGAPAHVLITGRVLAVNRGWITVGGLSHTMTARLTPATICNGRAIRPRTVQVGDTVTARIDNPGSRAIVTALRTPAQIR